MGKVSEFSSPGYPNNYTRNTNCQWTLTAPAGNKVAVQCPDFKIPSSTNCQNDVLTLNSLKYCGGGVVSAQSPSNKMVAALKTTTNQGKFYCKATAVPNECDCGRRKIVSHLYCDCQHVILNFASFPRPKLWVAKRRVWTNLPPRPIPRTARELCAAPQLVSD